MARATKFRDGAHARVYRRWYSLPAWRSLSPAAKLLLVAALAHYHPENNPTVRRSLREWAELLDCSKATAGEALEQLEDRGWLEPIRRSRFGRNFATEHRFTLYPDPATGEPGSRAFEVWQLMPAAPRRPENRRRAGR